MNEGAEVRSRTISAAPLHSLPRYWSGRSAIQMLSHVAALCAMAMLITGCAATSGAGPTSQPVREPDWVQLTSGEWLKGRIRSMQHRSLDFESDKLKDLTLDWEDVKT